MKREIKTINKLKQYINIYAFKVVKKSENKKNKNKDSWRDYIIPTERKKENISEKIDNIVYNQ